MAVKIYLPHKPTCIITYVHLIEPYSFSETLQKKKMHKRSGKYKKNQNKLKYAKLQ